MSFAQIGIDLAERRIVPDAIVRRGIRKLCEARLGSLNAGAGSDRSERLAEFAERMRKGPIAPVPERANEQHYEVPASFYAIALGPHRKYSGCFWPEGTSSLRQAEEQSLSVTCDRAELRDGMKILELGCGWGSLTLFMAARFPQARITAVSNSASQRSHILQQAEERGLHNVDVITCDMNDFRTDERFDRIVSVEMFEHMRNYEELLRRVASWLRPGGLLFVHIFAHRNTPYEFDTDGAANWMGRHFFTGGIMPSADIFSAFERDMRVRQSWFWDGTHYQRTAEAWLSNLDANREQAISVLKEHGDDARVMFNRWRMFFMACAETFGYAGGSEWLIGHYLLERVGDLNRTEQDR